MKRLLLLSLVIASIFVIAACGQSGPTVSDAWVRSAPEGVMVSAAYMTIDGDDTLVGVSVPSDVAEMAEVHKTTSEPAMSGEGSMDMNQGTSEGAMDMKQSQGSMDMKQGDKMMGMEPAGPVAINGSLQLKPGGYHIMLMGVKKPLVAGENVAITLKFDKAGDIVVNAPVRENG